MYFPLAFFPLIQAPGDGIKMGADFACDLVELSLEVVPDLVDL
ncbi:hypothetical protein [Thermacetogenium phaeum]|nr:hypothetical protein [Thermacetogenium phaeum]